MSGRSDNPMAGHFLALDALRGIAALGVVFFHNQWLPGRDGSGYKQNGHLFVDFFFVLSGFVIALNYGKRLGTGAEFGRFLWLRFWRLYPLHLVVLLGFIALEVVKWYSLAHLGMTAHRGAFVGNDGIQIVYHLLLLQSVFGTAGALNEPSWSISAEFYAYVLFGLAVLATGRRNTWVCLGCLAITAVALVWNGNGLDDTNNIFALLRCLFGFSLGVLVHAVFARIPRPLPVGGAVAAAAAAIPLLLMAAFIGFNRSLLADFTVPLLSAAAILALVELPANAVTGFLCTRPMVWLGQVSYSIYMVHDLLLKIVDDGAHVVLHASMNDGKGFALPLATRCIVCAIGVGVTLLVSQFTYSWIEEPWRLWSKRARLGARREVAPAA